MESLESFYNIAILKHNQTFTYASKVTLDLGQLVEIPLRNRLVQGVVLKKVQKPDFECKVATPLPFYFSQTQIKLAEFITSYYFTTYAQSFSLFTPFSKECKKELAPLEFSPTPLSDKQQAALEFINSHNKTLLFGDTGSGKTEIYMHVLSETLKQGKNALFLMPEISLTPQMERRLSVVFGDCVAFWHSKVTKKKKEAILSGLKNGEIRILAGARSALFLPLINCGAILIDEEHDDAYKSSSNPRYNARDVALYLAKMQNIKIVLGSATPLATTYYNFKNKQSIFRLKGTHFETKNEYGFIKNLETLDPLIFDTLKQNFIKGGQSVVFIPTRANFKHLICQNCSQTLECPYCSVSLSLHKNTKTLKCHYCQFEMGVVGFCPKCNGELRSFRIGTQEFKEELESYFKEQNLEVKLECFDRDSITSAKKLAQILSTFNENKIDILIGTQMLVKGHDYHNVSLSVALGLDYALKASDYRAREKALSLMLQLSGRSGRKENGRVLIQTLNKDFFMQYLGDFQAFLEDELQARSGLYPPFMRLALVHFSHKKEQQAAILMQESLFKLESQIKNNALRVEIVGSGAAPIARIADKFRYIIFIRSQSANELHIALLALRDEECEIDIDPLDFV
ncbi:MAG: primosomal protein N' [Helicobacteraceae bacterium]|nr:primosomal protein N' [Helicobacteraceae bacterium]